MNTTRVLVIDNYDSFVYNLVHYLEELDCEVTVRRNDQLHLDDVAEFDKILLSPGPGLPDEAGLLKKIIEHYGATKSIFGVCLGQQAIGEVYGARLKNLDRVYHGVATPVQKAAAKTPIFKGLADRFEVGRYHSWVVDEATLPNELQVTAYDDNGQIMAIQHTAHRIQAVQFHPESVLTPDGKLMLKNWLSL